MEHCVLRSMPRDGTWVYVIEDQLLDDMCRLGISMCWRRREGLTMMEAREDEAILRSVSMGVVRLWEEDRRGFGEERR